MFVVRRFMPAFLNSAGRAICTGRTTLYVFTLHYTINLRPRLLERPVNLARLRRGHASTGRRPVATDFYSLLHRYDIYTDNTLLPTTKRNYPRRNRLPFRFLPVLRA